VARLVLGRTLAAPRVHAILGYWGFHKSRTAFQISITKRARLMMRSRRLPFFGTQSSACEERSS